MRPLVLAVCAAMAIACKSTDPTIVDAAPVRTKPPSARFEAVWVDDAKPLSGVALGPDVEIVSDGRGRSDSSAAMKRRDGEGYEAVASCP